MLAPIVGRTLVLPVSGCPATTRWERLTATVAPGIAVTPVTTIKPSLMPGAVIQASPLSVVPVAWRVPPVLAAPLTPGIAEIAATSTEGLGQHVVSSQICFEFVECRINTNTRTYSHPRGRPRGEGLAPPLRPTHTNPARCRGGGRWGMLP